MTTLFRAVQAQLFRWCVAGSLCVLQACSSSSSAPAPDFVLTQEKLDSLATSGHLLEAGIIGDRFHVFHKGPTSPLPADDLQTINHSLRDVISTTSSINDDQPTGTVYVRMFYSIADTTQPNRDSLLSVMVMVKHDPGFFKDGGDWEYIKIPITAGVAPPKHPYGLLDNASSEIQRGKIESCANCHQETTSLKMKNFLF
jgi:hypothetical protein